MKNSANSSIVEGTVAALPVVLGYLPYGLSFGILARQVEMTLLEVLLMSSVVYAGAAQLIVVGLLQAGQPLISIVATTLFVNIRYLLLCSAITPFLSQWQRWQRLLLAYFVSDETFAVLTSKFSQAKASRGYGFSVNTIAMLGWVGSCSLGHYASTLIGNMELFGLDFALPAVFIALLLILMRTQIMLVVALVAGVVALAIYLAGLPRLSVIVAAIIAATVGVWIEAWKSKTSC